MAGFAAFIGGAGNAAREVGAQVRTVLEQRRGAFADLLARNAQEEPDPQRRAEYLQHAADLYAGKDMGKIVPAAIKTLQTHTQNDAALAGAIGGPPATPKTPTPGPAAPGQTPGTTPAAQPSTSPVQPQAQIQPIPTQAGDQPAAPTPAPAPTPQQVVSVGDTSSMLPPGLPQPQSVQDIYHKYASLPEFSTPAGFARLKPMLDQEIAHNEALRQGQEQLQSQLAYKRAGLNALKNSPIWNTLLPYQRAAYEAEAGGMSPISMPGYTMMPRVVSPSTPGNAAPSGLMDAYGAPIKRTAGDLYRIETDMMNGERWYPITPQTAITQTPGGMQVTNRQGGQSIAPVEGAVPPAMNTPRTAPTTNGGVEVYQPSTVGKAAPVKVPGAVTPSMATTQRSNESQQLPTGETVSTTTTRKVFGGEASKPPSTGVQTHNASGQVLGNPKFQQDVNTTVSALMQPNLSESQQNTLFKRLVGPEKSPMAEAVRAEIRRRTVADLTAPLSWDMSTAERAQLSTQALQHIQTIDGLIGKLDKQGQLGPVMSRWNEFWTGNIGKDLTQNQDYVTLKNQVDLLTKVMGRIHGGARGGGSIQMINSFANKLNTDKMDAATLKGAIGAEREWLSTYANPKSGISPVGGGNPAKELKPGDIEDGYRYMGGDKGNAANWQQVRQ